MSFDISGLGQISVTGVGAPRWWTYKKATDTKSTIVASGYFNSVMQNLTTGVGMFAVGDVIHVHGSDGYGLYRVSAVTTAVTVAHYEVAAILNGMIETADLADNAVTSAKIYHSGSNVAIEEGVTLGLSTKLSQNLVRGRLKLDVRPTGGTTEDYAYQIRSESAKTSGTHWGIDSETHLKADGTTSLRGVQGVTVVDSTFTATSATFNAIYGQVRADGTFTGSGFMAALYGLVEASAAITASHVCACWLDTHQVNAITGSYQLLYMTENGSQALDQVMFIRAPGAVAFAEFDTCSTFVSDTAETGGSSKKIKITIDGVAYYINAYTG